MGYEYELISQFAKYTNNEIRIIPAYSIDELNEIIKNNSADVIAYPLINDTILSKSQYTPCGTKRITFQVLIQNKQNQKNQVTDVTQLRGKEIYVENNSRFHKRLINLNHEIGGGIIIKSNHQNQISSDELIRKVAKGEIDYTIADNNFANLNATFFNNIDSKLPISCEQISSWLISKTKPELKIQIDEWFNKDKHTPTYAPIVKRYYEKSIDSTVTIKYLLQGNKSLSVYDQIYKDNAAKLGWDWRLLAALSFEESRFDPYAISCVGARGLLQMMPKTGYRFGLTENTFTDPDENIKAGTRYLNSLQQIFKSVDDPDQKAKFVLASFHAGVGHILDARAIARKYGYNPDIWDNNVSSCLILKGESEIYKDSTIVKCGFFNGITTLEHVNNITSRYKEFTQRINH